MLPKYLVLGLAATLIAGSAANSASPQAYGGYQGSSNSYDQNGHSDMWAGAPQDPRQRIDWLQQRINRGEQDGSLNPREARNSQTELNNIRHMARNFSRHDGRELAPQHANFIQSRLDNLSQRLHWQRHNGQEGRDRGMAGPSPQGGHEPYATTYDASRDYRESSNYQERQLSANDQVYRGSDGRYYCKRSDGTTGLVVGAVGGGVLGNVIEGGHNRVAGTLIGGALGALAGKAIEEHSDTRCH